MAKVTTVECSCTRQTIITIDRNDQFVSLVALKDINGRYIGYASIDPTAMHFGEARKNYADKMHITSYPFHD